MAAMKSGLPFATSALQRWKPSPQFGVVATCRAPRLRGATRHQSASPVGHLPTTATLATCNVLNERFYEKWSTVARMPLRRRTQLFHNALDRFFFSPPTGDSTQTDVHDVICLQEFPLRDAKWLAAVADHSEEGSYSNGKRYHIVMSESPDASDVGLLTCFRTDKWRLLGDEATTRSALSSSESVATHLRPSFISPLAVKLGRPSQAGKFALHTILEHVASGRRLCVVNVHIPWAPNSTERIQLFRAACSLLVAPSGEIDGSNGWEVEVPDTPLVDATPHHPGVSTRDGRHQRDHTAVVVARVVAGCTIRDAATCRVPVDRVVVLGDFNTVPDAMAGIRRLSWGDRGGEGRELADGVPLLVQKDRFSSLLQLAGCSEAREGAADDVPFTRSRAIPPIFTSLEIDGSRVHIDHVLVSERPGAQEPQLVVADRLLRTLPCVDCLRRDRVDGTAAVPSTGTCLNRRETHAHGATGGIKLAPRCGTLIYHHIPIERFRPLPPPPLAAVLADQLSPAAHAAASHVDPDSGVTLFSDHFSDHAAISVEISV